MAPITSPDIRTVNSTSYADVAGLQLGLQRLPGEETSAFLIRLYEAQVAKRDHSYQGTLNEVALHLGLATRQGIQITATDPNALITADVAGVRVTSNNITTVAPLFTLQPDAVWKWRMLSDVVADLNKVSGLTAALSGKDAPALQIAKQSNVYTVVAEAISGSTVKLLHSGVIVSSISFNQPVPAFTAATSGLLTFAGEVPDLTTITYQYRVLPYGLVCCEASVIGLTEPTLASVAVQNGVLAYQVREALQEIMSRDRSYWSK